jgi:hypothetical protein
MKSKKFKTVEHLAAYLNGMVDDEGKLDRSWNEGFVCGMASEGAFDDGEEDHVMNLLLY